MPATLNALRRFLADSGCVEERVLRDAASTTIFIEFRCARKSGRVCRSVIAIDLQAPQLVDRLLERIGRNLAPCLGRGWETRIPQEDPFG